MAWLQYKFKENELVYCPSLKKEVTIKYKNYERMWIGPINDDSSDTFWEKNLSGSGFNNLQ